MFLCMGTKSVKLEPEMSFESLPRQEVDPKRVGDVYVLAYSCGPESVEEVEKKRAHYSLLIDVSGASTEESLHGLEIHFIVIDFDNRDIGIRFAHTNKPFSNFLLVRRVGTLQNEFHSGYPRRWALALEEVIYDDWFPSFLVTNGNQWNSQCNCQQFIRFLVGQFNLVWPADLSVVGDVVPLVVRPEDELMLLPILLK
eukprot:TRINITY_DN12666_c0_g1_i3.p1 TRINITY_DN12666_c0_g1~~TRINITY_DN12666_c0_g1_i3.p1  ORF type:complete len:198 (+),score=17.28 TRINITY_DN12666_c0_g1_i3:246-839(+)